jgi:hypothetical protein
MWHRNVAKELFLMVAQEIRKGRVSISPSYSHIHSDITTLH